MINQPENNNTCKDWTFTLNNYTDEDLNMFAMWCNPDKPEVNMATISKEVGATGTPHLQGRIILKTAKRFTAMKKLHSKVHWGWTKMQEDSLYCMKEGSDVIHNVDFRRQGKRSDLEGAIKMAKDGATDRQLWTEHAATMCRFERGIKRCRDVFNEDAAVANYTLESFAHVPRAWKPITNWSKSIILLGPPGVGKTEFAKAHFGTGNFLLVSDLDDLLRFNKYEHKGIIFDDVDFSGLSRTIQIHLYDQDNPRSIRCRYANANIPAKTKKIFTCNELTVDLDDYALARRVSVTEVS